MVIVEIFPPFLYSMRYGDEQDSVDEFHRLLNNWTDIDWLDSYFEGHSTEMSPSFWGEIIDPEIAASRTLKEAYDADETFRKLADNSSKGKKPDFEDFFFPLNGEYVYEWHHTPVKAYGPDKPSLIRFYAIKLDKNCFLLTGGGIKYCKSMNESPDLRKELQKIEQTRSFLKECGIDKQDDI